jgi:phage baseplate assembly protein W
MSVALSDKNTTDRNANQVAVRKLYADLSTTFALHPGTLDIKPITDIDAVRQSVKNLVVSAHHERPFHPEYGSNITAYLFEPVGILTAISIRDEIVRVINRFEPRVSNVAVKVYDDIDRNAYSVDISFNVTEAQVETNFSFYLDRIR